MMHEWADWYVTHPLPDLQWFTWSRIISSEPSESCLLNGRLTPRASSEPRPPIHTDQLDKCRSTDKTIQDSNHRWTRALELSVTFRYPLIAHVSSSFHPGNTRARETYWYSRFGLRRAGGMNVT